MRVLHVSAHADDETLGAGGVLLRHLAHGNEVGWAVATQPWTGSAPRVWTHDQVSLKGMERHAVRRAYPMSRLWEFGFPAAGLDTVPMARIVEAVAQVVAEWEPEVVYTVGLEDAHSDHRILALAVRAAIRGYRRRSVRRLLECDTLSAQGRPAPMTLYADIEGFLDRKVEIFQLYASEADESLRNPDAIRLWAAFRGAEAGLRQAEAFRLIWAVE